MKMWSDLLLEGKVNRHDIYSLIAVTYVSLKCQIILTLNQIYSTECLINYLFHCLKVFIGWVSHIMLCVMYFSWTADDLF